MATKTRKKVTVSELAKEVRILRSFVIGLALKDPEGEYKQSFIDDVVTSANEPTTGEFTNSADLLRTLNKNEV